MPANNNSINFFINSEEELLDLAPPNFPTMCAPDHEPWNRNRNLWYPRPSSYNNVND